jgi:putative NADH-flavin reductase
MFNGCSGSNLGVKLERTYGPHKGAKMNITMFGASGSVGSECLKQAIEAGHNVTVLIRNKDKFNFEINNLIKIIEGDALEIDDVNDVIQNNTEAVIFAIGMNKKSPADLCTDATQNILDTMIIKKVKRFIFCSGASTILKEDKLTFGMKFVEFYARRFMPGKHNDKTHQVNILKTYENINWFGIRPVQIVNKSNKVNYNIGYITFSPLSKITPEDCAKEMIKMLDDDKWLKKMPIIHY